METKGPSPHDSPAREGGSDQFTQNCTTGGNKTCLLPGCNLDEMKGSNLERQRCLADSFLNVKLLLKTL